MTTKEKIKQASADAKIYPNSSIEYNFEEEIDEDWFGGVPHSFNYMCEKNTAKVIYSLK